MAYITYAEYTELGGKVQQSDFLDLERKARAKINFFTLDRLKTIETISDEVKEVMTEFINKLSIADDKTVTSYSNGVESFGYVAKDITDELYDIAIEMLPIELINAHRGIDDV